MKITKQAYRYLSHIFSNAINDPAMFDDIRYQELDYIMELFERYETKLIIDENYIEFPSFEH